MSKSKRAVFLDRDGVLNEMILNPKTGEHESPHAPADVILSAGTIDALKALKEFELFVVSNQPSAAKGKATMDDLKRVDDRFRNELREHGIVFKKVYYCFHHPEAVVPELKQNCGCRKPGNLFLEQAAREFGLDLTHSWMVGDRDIDVECGRSSGCKTVLIDYRYSKGRAGKSNPTFHARDVADAAEKILTFKGEIQ